LIRKSSNLFLGAPSKLLWILECISSSNEEEYNSSFSAEDEIEGYKDWLDQ